MTRAFKIDKTLRERRRIIRLLDFLKRDDLTGEQMERIGRRHELSRVPISGRCLPVDRVSVGTRLFGHRTDERHDLSHDRVGTHDAGQNHGQRHQEDLQPNAGFHHAYPEPSVNR